MNSEHQNGQQSLHKGVDEGGSGGVSSPPSSAASMLLIPHHKPDQHHVVTQNGSGRKYQCKMCPSGIGGNQNKPISANKLDTNGDYVTGGVDGRDYGGGGTDAEYSVHPQQDNGGQDQDSKLDHYQDHSPSSHLQQEINQNEKEPEFLVFPNAGSLLPGSEGLRPLRQLQKVANPGFLNNEKIFNSKSELQLHSQLHMREVKPYKCSQCSKTFANSSYLSQHTRIHLGIKPYRCEICQRKFTQLSHLQQHIRTHTGDKPYKCRHPGCTKAFSQLSNLQSHSRCHQTDKPYKCNSCYKCFTDEPSLLEHIPKHKESKHLKTHICQYCGKSYTQETYLTKHMQKHAERTDKRPPIIGIPRVGLDNPHYWPKVSPDTANTLVDAIQQQQQQQQQSAVVVAPQQQQQQQQQHDSYQTSNGVLSEHMHNRAEMNGTDHTTIHHSVASPNYHDSVISSSAGLKAASAFTPIQSMAMPPHHNHHLAPHHQLTDHHRAPPYLSYNALAFPAAKVATNGMDSMSKGPTNGFPNQLISLHQIRNYAHQPTALMTTEHLLQGLKEKGQ